MFDTFICRIRKDLLSLSAKAKRTVNVGGLGTDALWLTQAAQVAKEAGKRLVLILDNAADGLRLKDEIQFFDSTIRCDYFPDWETLPYDILSPHSDLVSERLQILFKLLSPNPSLEGPDVLLVSATTASQTIAPPSYLNGRFFYFKQNKYKK